MPVSYESLVSEFTSPSAALRPMIFWVWNGDMTREGIAEDIRDFADKRLGGFFIHPMGESFRLKDFIKGINPPYLSDEYFALVRHAVECARDAGLYAWLYDEGGWPSGTAQGHVLEGHPEHQAKVLSVECVDVTPTELAPPPPENCVLVLAFAGVGLPQVVECVGTDWTPPPGTSRALYFSEQPVEGRVDLLSPAAVARFIEVTHERYAAVVGEFFGNTVPGMFTDEPSVPGRIGTDAIQYTPGLFEAFAQRRGFDIRPYLPLLFAPEFCDRGILRHYEDTSIDAIRCEYADLWTDLYHEAYWKQINDWCAAHGLLHTGHVGGEDNLPDHIRGGFGHWFKTAGSLHVPGVDAIWRQVFPGADNADFPLLAASAVNQRALPRGDHPFGRAAISETNGVYSFGFTYEQMRWVADFQYQRGVNLYAPMAYHYATDSGRLYARMSHVGPGNPLWEHHAEFSDYIGRLSAALRPADPCCSIAVYYPIEDCWSAGADDAALVQTWERLREVTTRLAEEQVMYEYIDAATLCRAATEDGALITDGHAYLTVIVAGARGLPLAVMQKLKELHDVGGRVVFVRGIPSTCATFGRQADFTALTDELRGRAAVMGARAEAERGSGEDLSTTGVMRAAWDGFAAAYLGPGGIYRFAPEVLDPSALLIVPPEETKRMARLLSQTGGQFRLLVAEEQPHLRMNAFALPGASAPDSDSDTFAHFLTNEGPDEIPVDLVIVSDVPLRLEIWDCETGDIMPLIDHTEVTEGTSFSGALDPFESLLIVSRPLPSAVDGEVDGEPDTRRGGLLPALDGSEASTLSLILHENCEDIEVRRCFRIENGDVRECAASSVQLPQGEVELRPWEDWGLADFSGSIAYRFALPLAEGFRDARLLLRLGECLYVAEVWLNGELEATLLWGPYELEVTDALNVGHNDLVVVVTNTLANQALREDVLAEAKARGWFNSYCERAVPMMAESLPSGLIGPVELVAFME